MRPKPRISTRRLARSMAVFSKRMSQLPLRTSRSNFTPCLASDIMKKRECSATVTEFAVPVTVRGTPAAVSAGTSTLS